MPLANIRSKISQCQLFERDIIKHSSWDREMDGQPPFSYRCNAYLAHMHSKRSACCSADSNAYLRCTYYSLMHCLYSAFHSAKNDAFHPYDRKIQKSNSLLFIKPRLSLISKTHIYSKGKHNSNYMWKDIIADYYSALHWTSVHAIWSLITVCAVYFHWIFYGSDVSIKCE